jgi:hypothetical protein
MIKEGLEYDHLFDWVLISSSHLSARVFTVESFDKIKNLSDKKKN